MGKKNKSRSNVSNNRNSGGFNGLPPIRKQDDYSTPAKKKRYLEAECKRLADACDRVSDGQAESYLREPYGRRRQTAVFNYLDRAEEELKDSGLKSVVEAMAENEL